MVRVKLKLSTLAVLISGLYCVTHATDSLAIPESLWIEIAEKLEYFLGSWDYSKISLEEWITSCLTIYPKIMCSEEDIEWMKGNTLYWERLNGNIELIVSMDIGAIN